MQTTISFRTSTMPRHELRRTLSDYLALERARVIRQVLVTRFGGIAAIAGSAMTIAHLFSPVARILAIGLCVVPPLGAWIAEIALAHRLVQRIARSSDVFTTSARSDRCGEGRTT